MSAVEKYWPGETFVVLGCGPSLDAADVEYCRGRARVMAINTAFTVAPWADVLFATDWKWWRWHAEATATFPGLKYTVRDRSKRRWYPDATPLTAVIGSDFQTDPSCLGTPSIGQSCSGYLALNLAVHLGAARILLLGYDLCRDDRGRSHFFGEHPDGIKPPLSGFVAAFQALVAPLRKLGVTVVNCSRHTVLKTFPRQSLREALC